MGRPRKYQSEEKTECALGELVGKKSGTMGELRDELDSLVQWLDSIGNGDLARMPEEGPRIVAQNARVRAYNIRQLLKVL